MILFLPMNFIYKHYKAHVANKISYSYFYAWISRIWALLGEVYNEPEYLCVEI